MTNSSLPNITLSADTLHDDEIAMRREWLVTNGLGGYASSTVSTANTRRYHGLLVAALKPPLGRAVLLSKLEESLDVVFPDGAGSPTFALSANIYPGVIYPQGHRLLESWSAYPCPTWVWSPMAGVRLEKRVRMAEYRNATYISYRLLEAPPGTAANLHVSPLIAWKDYHTEQHAENRLPAVVWFPVTPGAARLPDSPRGLLRATLPKVVGVTDDAVELNLAFVREDGTPFAGVTFNAQAYWYYHLQHPREQERGLDFSEDLYGLGTFSATLSVGDTLVVIAATDDSTPPNAEAHDGAALPEEQPPAAVNAAHVAAQRAAYFAAPEDPFGKLLRLAADAFLVHAPGGRSTIIAGYPWFSDWGRDTMIALPGLALTLGRTTEAREILLTYAAFVDHGMLPNRFPDSGQAPEYNTVDATLWYFAAVYRYVAVTGDQAVLQTALWKVLDDIVGWWFEGTRYNIHSDPADSLVYAGQEGVQLTWMDARIGDWVVTPRIGKPVEINALWHNALQCMAYFAARLADAEAAQKYERLAAAVSTGFAARYPMPDGRGLYDVLDTPAGGAPDSSVRPNQIFAISLPFPPIDPRSTLAAGIVKTVHDELWTPVGLRTLSPHDPAYRPRYEGDQLGRDSAYHQGTAWPWLLGPFVEAHLKVVGDPLQARAFLAPLREQLAVYGMGSLAEVYDGAAPQRPNGCIAQAWSIAEILRVWQLLEETDGR